MISQGGFKSMKKVIVFSVGSNDSRNQRPAAICSDALLRAPNRSLPAFVQQVQQLKQYQIFSILLANISRKHNYSYVMTNLSLNTTSI